MLTCVDTAIRVWENSSSEQPEVIEVPLDYISTCTYLKDNRTLITGGKSSTIYFTDLYTRIQRQFELENGEVSYLTSNKEGNEIVIGTTDGKIIVVLYPNFKILKRYSPHNFPIVGIEYTKDEKALISADDHGHISISKDDKSEPFLKLGARNGVIHSFSLSSTGESLALSSGKTLRVFDVETSDLKILHDIGAVATVNFSPVQENVIIMGTSYGDVQIFDVNQGAVVLEHQTGKPITTAAIKYDGYTYAAGYSGGIMLFDLRKSEQNMKIFETARCITPNQIVFQSADISSEMAQQGLSIHKKEQTLQSLTQVEESYDDGDYSVRKFTFKRSIQEINESKSKVSGFISPFKSKNGQSSMQSATASPMKSRSRDVSIVAPPIPSRSQISENQEENQITPEEMLARNKQSVAKTVSLQEKPIQSSSDSSPIQSSQREPSIKASPQTTPKAGSSKKSSKKQDTKVDKTEASLHLDDDDDLVLLSSDSDIVIPDDDDDSEGALSPEFKTVLKVKKEAQPLCEEAAEKRSSKD